MRQRGRSFRNDESGAVAATYAIALMGLIVVAGVGFDYARLATMDSELQNGADQAALAGATQLDGQPGACARAAKAALELVGNITILANDGDEDGNKVTILDDVAPTDCSGSSDPPSYIRFYQDEEKTTLATSDADAHFIELRVDARVARYALTPVMGAFNSGDISAAAMAGLGSSICKVPPIMLCNPFEATDPDFTTSNFVGKGLRLTANDGGGYVPGNFGYLETNAGNGAIATARTLGRVEVPGDCVATDDVTTKPGEQISVLDALNTRFDVYANGLNNVCGNGNGLCPPSANSRKDVMRTGNGCAFSSGNGGNGWKLPENPYLPSSATPLTAAELTNLSPMGYPRDMCHAYNPVTGCGAGYQGRLGDGNWDRNAYFSTNTANYPTVPTSSEMTSMFGTDTPTRYEVYKYEAANAAARLKPQTINGRTSHGAAVCVPPGVPVNADQPDRRVLPVAIVNCSTEGVQGKTENVHITKWIDVFLVEPALPRARTEASDVYVEVIGETQLGGGGNTAAQTIRRDVPYLVR